MALVVGNKSGHVDDVLPETKCVRALFLVDALLAPFGGSVQFVEVKHTAPREQEATDGAVLSARHRLLEHAAHASQVIDCATRVVFVVLKLTQCEHAVECVEHDDELARCLCRQPLVGVGHCCGSCMLKTGVVRATMSMRLGAHLEMLIAAHEKQAAAVRRMDSELQTLFEGVVVPRERSLYEKIENCMNRSRIWSMIESNVDLYGAAELSESVPIGMFSFLISALVADVALVRVHDPKTLCLSKNRTQPGDPMPMFEPGESRFDGHVELNSAERAPLQLIHILHYILMQIQCDEALEASITNIDTQIDAVKPALIQYEQCLKGMCGHSVGSEDDSQLDICDDPPGCTRLVDLEKREIGIRSLVSELLISSLLKQPYIDQVNHIIQSFAGTFRAYKFGAGSVILAKPRTPENSNARTPKRARK